MNLTINTLFGKIESHVFDFRNNEDQRSAVVLQLEKLADSYKDQASLSLHIHTYEEQVNLPNLSISREQLWQAILCKAAQPQEFVPRIASSEICGEKRSDGFVRNIVLTETFERIGEDVYISTDAVLFRQHHPKQFVAINRLVERSGNLFVKGTYFDADARTHQQFMESATSVLQLFREKIRNGKVAELFAKHYPMK